MTWTLPEYVSCIEKCPSKKAVNHDVKILSFNAGGTLGNLGLAYIIHQLLQFFKCGVLRPCMIFVFLQESIPWSTARLEGHGKAT